MGFRDENWCILWSRWCSIKKNSTTGVIRTKLSSTLGFSLPLDFFFRNRLSFSQPFETFYNSTFIKNNKAHCQIAQLVELWEKKNELRWSPRITELPTIRKQKWMSFFTRFDSRAINMALIFHFIFHQEQCWKLINFYFVNKT